MGLIINPRGIGGSGKTELVRRILTLYGWRRGLGSAYRGSIQPVFRTGRSRPFGYRLEHPFGARPLVVLGHYEATSGGCDTIRLADGGLAEIVRCAGIYASSGHDVVIEGLRLSSDIEHSLALTDSHDFRILHLRTPLQRCVSNLARRRRAGRGALAPLARAAEAQQRSVEEACEWFRGRANVEALTFDDALTRAERLLGLALPNHAPY